MAGKVKQQEYQPSGEVKRIVPLGNNEYADLFNHEGKTMHCKRSDQSFVDACTETDERVGGRVRRDLTALQWFDVIEKMDSNSKPEE